MGVNAALLRRFTVYLIPIGSLRIHVISVRLAVSLIRIPSTPSVMNFRMGFVRPFSSTFTICCKIVFTFERDSAIIPSPLLLCFETVIPVSL